MNTPPSSLCFFPFIKDKIRFDTGKDDQQKPFSGSSFRYYNPDEKIRGKAMRDHLRFSVCFWHTWRGTGQDPFGGPTLIRPWDAAHSDDPKLALDAAFMRLKAHFEFCSKLGVDFWTFHDRDIAPEGHTLQETNENLDRVVAAAKQLQNETGIRLLWGTANLFSHRRYMNGAATNPDAHGFAYAAVQVKKAMEITNYLGGENYVFWGGREGYSTLLNTDMRRDLDHMARFFTMATDFQTRLGFTGQLLIEPKPREPTKHQYDYDAATVMNFLGQYGLKDRFKLNIEANHATLAGHTFEHELTLASSYSMLGSIDANTGDTLLGWDTDQFNLDPKSTALAMRVVLDNSSGKGISPGGLNFDAKVRRESVDLQDLFYAHIGSMDTFARGLRVACAIKEDRILDRFVSERYSSYSHGIGAQIENGQIDFEGLEEHILSMQQQNQEPNHTSGRQEYLENLISRYI